MFGWFLTVLEKLFKQIIEKNFSHVGGVEFAKPNKLRVEMFGFTLQPDLYEHEDNNFLCALSAPVVTNSPGFESVPEYAHPTAQNGFPDCLN